MNMKFSKLSSIIRSTLFHGSADPWPNSAAFLIHLKASLFLCKCNRLDFTKLPCISIRHEFLSYLLGGIQTVFASPQLVITRRGYLAERGGGAGMPRTWRLKSIARSDFSTKAYDAKHAFGFSNRHGAKCQQFYGTAGAVFGTI